MIRREQHVVLTVCHLLKIFCSKARAWKQLPASRVHCILQTLHHPQLNESNGNNKQKYEKKLPAESENFFFNISPWHHHLPPFFVDFFAPGSSLSLFWRGYKVASTTWRLSDVDSVIIIHYISHFPPSCPVLFRFLFIYLPLSLRNIMEKQITASPVQAATKIILQQKVKTQKPLLKSLLLKPNYWLTC